jgi:quercetin dioxygenase-like cupin family protein
MNIIRNGREPSQRDPEDHFTGNVRIDPLIETPAPPRLLGATVTFEPGARTAWHSHRLGQTLTSLPATAWCSAGVSLHSISAPAMWCGVRPI